MLLAASVQTALGQMLNFLFCSHALVLRSANLKRVLILLHCNKLANRNNWGQIPIITRPFHLLFNWGQIKWTII
jgi:hypothetical protein